MNLLALVISTLFIVNKGYLVNNSILIAFDLDIVIIVITYLLAFQKETSAVFFAFGLGLITDIFSGGILGLFTFIYTIIFFIIKTASYPIDPQSGGGQFAVVFMSVLLKNLLIIILMQLFSMEVILSVKDVVIFFSSALVSGLITPFLIHFTNYITQFFIERGEELGKYL